ncbi:hypothetical protein FOA52_002029 [Chlamydomonas sp. UWO 241]|nr:hypothetical protein FOA52_002029 [Chlamydomonas sp. UWO 241]
MPMRLRALAGVLAVLAAAASAAAKEHLRVPRIYVYHNNLPERLHNHSRFGHIAAEMGDFYTMDFLFPALLKDSPYVTTDPEEADFFYVDAWMYHPWQDASDVVAALRAAGPWFDRKNGADHIFMVVADPGRCQFPQSPLANAIFMHHFGMLRRLTTEPCDLFHQWGAACDVVLTEAMAALHGSRKEVVCHRPGQDIIVPPAPYEFTPDNQDQNGPGRPHFPTPYVQKEWLGKHHANRTVVLYYAGEIDVHATAGDARNVTTPWSDAHYSFGLRQLLYRLHHDAPGFNIRTTHARATYWEDLSSSIFCVAAAGWAWGGRMKVAVTRGCIPVILQDGIRVEWEEQLPLHDYALRVPSWMVHKLPQILTHVIHSGRAARMQRVLDCAWRLHWWRRPHGRAFEMVMCELKRRALGAAPGHVGVDWDKCELRCGDDVPVPLRHEYNNV